MFTKSKTKRMEGGMQGDIMIRGGMGGMIEDTYSEKPRPNLYNVIKKIRDQKGAMMHRICYISKLDESVFRGDFEKELTNFTNSIVSNQEEDEIPL